MHMTATSSTMVSSQWAPSSHQWLSPDSSLSHPMLLLLAGTTCMSTDIRERSDTSEKDNTIWQLEQVAQGLLIVFEDQKKDKREINCDYLS